MSRAIYKEPGSREWWNAVYHEWGNNERWATPRTRRGSIRGTSFKPRERTAFGRYGSARWIKFGATR